MTRGPVVARAAGLLLLGALTVGLLVRGLTPSSGGPLAFIHFVDLVFHEAGHVIFGFLGTFAGVLGGSLNQVLVPAVCTGAFLRQGRRAEAAVTLAWTGESVVDVAVYAADGRDMRLPLLAEGLVHDWNWILSELSLRDQAEPIGRALFGLGALILLAALVLLALDLRRARATPASTGVLRSAPASDRTGR